MSPAFLRGLLLVLLVPGCATPRGAQAPAPVPIQQAPPRLVPAAAPLPRPPVSPSWNDPEAVKYLWPQGAGLAEAKLLCPFVYPPAETGGATLTAAYHDTRGRRGPFALHVAYRGPFAPSGAGFGVGCLQRYDASLYGYVSFWVKGRPGLRFHFRLKDTSQTEGGIERQVKQEGWGRMVIPLSDFAGVNLRSLATFSLDFEDSDAELDVDDVEFTSF